MAVTRSQTQEARRAVMFEKMRKQRVWEYLKRADGEAYNPALTANIDFPELSLAMAALPLSPENRKLLIDSAFFTV